MIRENESELTNGIVESDLSTKQKILSKLKLLIDRRVIVSILLYGFMGFVAIMSNEVRKTRIDYRI